MKAVIQRVLAASVSVNDNVISSIGRGLCVLIGIGKEDTDADLNYIVEKILKLKLFEGEDGKKWDHSIADEGYEILCVSQFTLYHSLKGNKLDFHHAMPYAESKLFYDNFLRTLRSRYKSELIQDGKFGALMQVNIVNDGPVTVQLESSKKSEIAESFLKYFREVKIVMSRFRNENPDCKIYVGDLSSQASKQDVEDAFSYYGPIKNVWVARNPPGFAFVEFEDIRDAEDAIKEVDGRRTVRGRRVRVERAGGKRGGGGGYRRPFRGGRRGRPFHPEDRCYECGVKGHYAKDCRARRRNGRYSRGRGGRSYSRSRSRSDSRDRRSRSRNRHSRSRDRSSRSHSSSRSRTPSRSRSNKNSRSRSTSRNDSRSHRDDKSFGRNRSNSKAKSDSRSVSPKKEPREMKREPREVKKESHEVNGDA